MLILVLFVINLNFVFYLCRIDLEDIAKDLIEGFKDADIIMGKMLDGSVIQFEKNAEKFNAGDISYEEFSDKIKLFDDKDQICFGVRCLTPLNFYKRIGLC